MRIVLLRQSSNNKVLRIGGFDMVYTTGKKNKIQLADFKVSVFSYNISLLEEKILPGFVRIDVYRKAVATL